MGFLDDMNLDEVEAASDDFSIPNGVYPAMISDSKIMQPKKSPNKNMWQITYKLDDEVETYGGRTVSEFYDLDPALPEQRKSFLKRRLVSLGITDDEAAGLEPSDIVGVEVAVTVRNRTDKNDPDKTYTNVTKVTLSDATTVAAASYLSNF